MEVVKHFIYEQTGKQIQISPRIMHDRRQLEMLEDAVKVVNYHYNKGKVKVL